MYSIYPMYFIAKRRMWMGYFFEMFRTEERSGNYISPYIEYPFTDVYAQFPEHNRILVFQSL